MVKIFVYYDSKYGNTKLAAEKVVEGLRSVNSVDADLGYVKKVELQEAVCYDAVVFGAPNHMGRPSVTMKNFIGHLSGLDFKAKSVAIFGTYSGRARPQDRAEKKLEALVKQNLPNLKQVLPGLSVRVNGVSGPVVEDELPKCVEFGRKIAAKLQT
jgi:NADH oxidase (H2O-forming)